MPSKRKITAKKPLFGNLRSHSMRATNASQMCSKAYLCPRIGTVCSGKGHAWRDAHDRQNRSGGFLEETGTLAQEFIVSGLLGA
jgi:hypothetical protein